MYCPERQLWTHFPLSLGAVYSTEMAIMVGAPQKQGISLFESQIYPQCLDFFQNNEYVLNE